MPVAEDHLAVAASPRVGFHGQISEAAGGVQRDELVQGVELHAAVGQRHQLAPAPRGRVVLRGEEEARHSRGRLVDDRELAEAVGVPEPRDRGKLGVHLQPRGAAGEEQVWQAGLRGDGSVDQEGVVDQNALGTPFDREPGRGRIAAHQRGFDAEVADDLQVGGDAAVGAEGARGRRAAHGELGDVSVVAFRVLAAATVTSLSRLMPPSAKLASSTPSSLRTVTRAFWIWRSPAALCSWGVSTKVVAVRLLTVRSAVGATPPLFSRAVIDGADVRLQGAHAAVDGRHRAAEGVEGGHQGVAAVALGLAPAVRLDLDDAAVAQDHPPASGGLKSRLRMKFGVNCSWTRWKRPLPSATAGFRAKYLASSGAQLLLLR